MHRHLSLFILWNSWSIGRLGSQLPHIITLPSSVRHLFGSIHDALPLSPAPNLALNSVSPVYTGCVFTELPAPEIALAIHLVKRMHRHCPGRNENPHLMPWSSLAPTILLNPACFTNTFTCLRPMYTGFTSWGHSFSPWAPQENEYRANGVIQLTPPHWCWLSWSALPPIQAVSPTLKTPPSIASIMST